MPSCFFFFFSQVGGGVVLGRQAGVWISISDKTENENFNRPALEYECM